MLRKGHGAHGKPSATQINRTNDRGRLVGDEQDAIGRDRDRPGKAEARLASEPVQVATLSCPGHALDLARAGHPDDLVEAAVGQVDTAVARGRNASREPQRPPEVQPLASQEGADGTAGVDEADG